jgi:hypothetical protein
MITIIVVLALLTQPLQATWDGPHRARITHGPGCLWVDDAFYKCYNRAGVLILGDRGPLDYKYRPTAGSIFTLVSPSGTVERARLTGRAYLAVWRGG